MKKLVSQGFPDLNLLTQFLIGEVTVRERFIRSGFSDGNTLTLGKEAYNIILR